MLIAEPDVSTTARSNEDLEPSITLSPSIPSGPTVPISMPDRLSTSHIKEIKQSIGKQTLGVTSPGSPKTSPELNSTNILRSRKFLYSFGGKELSNKLLAGTTSFTADMRESPVELTH